MRGASGRRPRGRQPPARCPPAAPLPTFHSAMDAQPDREDGCRRRRHRWLGAAVAVAALYVADRKNRQRRTADQPAALPPPVKERRHLRPCHGESHKRLRDGMAMSAAVAACLAYLLVGLSNDGTN